MIEPHWVFKFRDFPEIPSCKRWVEGVQYTLEQQALRKAVDLKVLTRDEEGSLKEANAFYKIVIPLLKSIDFSDFSVDDYKEFKGYFNYVFNTELFSSNNVYCHTIFRIVKNFDLLKEQKSVPSISFLKYPPKEIVKQIGKFNRANTPESNLFYGAYSINFALLETKPQKGEMITIGVWCNNNPNRRIFTYPISHGAEAILVNPEVKIGHEAFLKIKEKNHPLFSEFMELIFDFLGYEFSKKVDNHIDYFYSAIYSERIFENRDPNWDFEAIIYPSIQNSYKNENLAIRPDFFDAQFHIERVYELVIEDCFYDMEIVGDNIFDMSYIKPYYIKEPEQMGLDGSIIW